MFYFIVISFLAFTAMILVFIGVLSALVPEQQGTSTGKISRMQAFFRLQMNCCLQAQNPFTQISLNAIISVDADQCI